ncbi:DUF92 domain-containing protein [Neobacillus sp. LXY-4]|uniref:DUF92 domain-containing protein n=1 Tax=Neobacillus sp. LXY-4 TaxID=3379826 RepID=UPI003EDEB9BA
MINIMIYATVIFITAISGYSFRFLTKSGALAAAIIGGAVALGFGWKGLFVLGTFFFTSSIWSKFKRDLKKRIEEKHVKGSRRDWQQVIANGGIAAIFSIFNFSFEHDIWLLGFSIAIASANSDTWASELGTLSKKPPLLIRTFKRSEKGTSGAISMLGSTAGFLGAFLIAIITSLLFRLGNIYLIIILLFGFLGNIFDTILGAFLQASYKCPICLADTEKKVHCNQPASLNRGFSFMNNDVVNFLSGLLAAISGIVYNFYLL